MTRRWKFITILAVGTSVTATGLGVGLGVGLHSSWTTNVQWYGLDDNDTNVLNNEYNHFKNKNLLEILEEIIAWNKKTSTWEHNQKQVFPIVADKKNIENSYLILEPNKIFNVQKDKKTSLPSVKNKDIIIIISVSNPISESLSTNY